MREASGMFVGGGEMGERIRDFDWAGTPFGPSAGWPQALQVSLGLCLNSTFPVAIYWGRDLRLIYNDNWSSIPGGRHPHVLGQPAHEVWSDVWHIVGPQFHDVVSSGRGYSTSDQHLPLIRSGRREESYWDYSFTPIIGDDGAVAGILNQGHEVTARVLERERHNLLLGLADRMRPMEDADAMVAEAIDTLGVHLGVARAGYAEIDLAAGTLHIVHNWRRDAGVADLRGVHMLGTFGSDLHAALKSGAIYTMEDAAEDPRVAGTPLAAVYAAIGLRAGLVVPVLKGGAYAAAIFVQSDRPHHWTTHHEVLLTGVGERIFQEAGRARAARALRESEERHRLIFEQANDIIFTTDLHQTVTGANPAAGAALGVTADALIGRSIADFVTAEAFVQADERLRRKLDGGGTTRFEVPVYPGDGRELHWEINSSLSIDHAGQPIGLHAVARDVTERHAHEEDQRRLINELNHRVKNMLAQVQGLALQSFKGDRPIAESQQAFQARLSALAVAHDLLTREKWEGTTLDEVVAAATTPLTHIAGQVSLGGPPVAVPPKIAVSLIMAFHEMATNAAQYGALSTGAGRVDIAWRQEADDRLVIEWREDGGPTIAPPARRGFGLRMAERTLATDLAAQVKIDFPDTGLVCRIESPLPCALPGAIA